MGLLTSRPWGVPIVAEDSRGEAAVIGADPHGSAKGFALLHQRREHLQGFAPDTSQPLLLQKGQGGVFSGPPKSIIRVQITAKGSVLSYTASYTV